MRRIISLLALAVIALTISAQTPTEPKSSAPGNASLIRDLPVRKVVLYKNGVGYFEHAGSVNGNQKVAIDFTSPQLNDVLQSLTVLDEGGGRIAGVNYNSTTPLAEQLKSLSLGMTDAPTTTELFQALRGQRVEVTGVPGGVITGRLMSIESRTEKSGSGDNTLEKFYLTLVAGSGAVRVVELTPLLSVRPLDASLQGQLDRYLELLSSTHSTGLRHLTLDALGQGQRELRVSYISEVPVWKSTYRMVFPKTANGNAIVQGWAVVDNTVGADWDQVQLSLVAGAPQSFIQPLSQPLYTRRPEIPIATEVETTPQTHEAAEMGGNGGTGAVSGTVTDQTGAVIAGARVTATSLATNATFTRVSSGNGAYTLGPLASGQYKLTIRARGFETFVENITVRGQQTATINARLTVGVESETVTVEADAMSVQTDSNVVSTLVSSEQISEIATKNRNFAALATLGAGVYRPSDAIDEGDVSTNAFDDFFEYALTTPVTIHKNESAMVPILQQELPAEHVTLWSEKESTPLRAVWLENKSKLTLDSGSFSIFESGEFAGEGLLDPIHPGEKRLLSYAADQAVRVKISARDSKQALHHVSFQKGIIIETYMDSASVTYSATNSAEADRELLLEHPRRDDGWTLDEGLKPEETSPSLYRFKLPVAAHSTQTLEVRERGPQYTTVDLRSNPRQEGFLLQLVKDVPDALAQIKPVMDAESAVAGLETKIDASRKAEATASADEARDRENLTALKGNDAAKRFVDELNRAEDQLQSTRKQTADLELQKQAALDKLNALISSITFDWSVSEK